MRKPLQLPEGFAYSEAEVKAPTITASFSRKQTPPPRTSPVSTQRKEKVRRHQKPSFEIYLIFFNSPLPRAALINTDSGQTFHLPTSCVVWESLQWKG